MNNINNFNPSISIIAVNFNGKCSYWYSFDTSYNIGKELDITTSTAGFTLKLMTILLILQASHLPAFTLFAHIILV